MQLPFMLTASEYQVVLRGLSKLPLEMSLAAFNSLQEQAAEHIKAEQASQEAKISDAPDQVSAT